MKTWLLLILTLSMSLQVLAQTPATSPVPPEMRQDAAKYYAASDWTRAAEAYGKIVSLEETNANARYRLASSLLNLNKNSEAIGHLEKVFAAAPNSVYAFTLARAYARLGNKAKVFETIESSLKLGGIAPESLTSDKDLAAYQSDVAFQDLVKRSDLAVNPCKAAPEFRQFDFWIGEWDVKTPNGGPAGSSSVQLILGQCIIFENWTSSSGSSGKSFNIFDVNDKKWHQTWVDDKGTFTHYIGGIENATMVLVAETKAAGKKTLAKMSFSKRPNGDVRQFGENSADDGKTWTTSFDLIYSRRK